MELDEFKAVWKKAERPVASSMTSDKKNNYMNTMDTIGYLNTKTAKAAKWNRMLMSMLMGIVSVGILLAFILPREATSITDGLPSFILFLLFCIVELRLTEKSKSIFENTSGVDLKTAITNIIQKWTRWYQLSNIVMIIFLPAMLYIYLSFVDDLTGLQVSTALKIITSILLTALSMYCGHLYYKSTYINRINELKKTLNELRQPE